MCSINIGVGHEDYFIVSTSFYIKLICANTLHKFADRMQKEIDVPIIHIADATAEEINNKNLSTVGLLGTKYTMEEDFYISKLEAANVLTIIPEIADREFIDATIYNELLKEIFKEDRKTRFLEIMKKLQREGAEGIILGCTEIPLLIKQEDYELPLFDTTTLHAQAAVKYSLNGLP